MIHFKKAIVHFAKLSQRKTQLFTNMWFYPSISVTQVVETVNIVELEFYDLKPLTFDVLQGKLAGKYRSDTCLKSSHSCGGHLGRHLEFLTFLKDASCTLP